MVCVLPTQAPGSEELLLSPQAVDSNFSVNIFSYLKTQHL